MVGKQVLGSNQLKLRDRKSLDFLEIIAIFKMSNEELMVTLAQMLTYTLKSSIRALAGA